MGAGRMCRVTVTGLSGNEFGPLSVDVPEDANGLVDAFFDFPGEGNDITLNNIPCPTIEPIFVQISPQHNITITVTEL